MDHQIFRYNESAGIPTLDPAFAKDQAIIWACTQLYNGLVQLDNNLEIKPSIAKHWTISDDGKTYTFCLRDDVLFHQDSLFLGKKRKVTAHDFVYSFRRLVSPELASPGRWIFADVDSIDDMPAFFALSDSILEIKIKAPFAPFLGLLTMPYCSVVPHEVVEHYRSDFRKHPVGTGPFFCKFWKEDVKLVLRKNNVYFEQDSLGDPLPYLEGVAITFITDKQTAFLEFIKGNIDFISGIDVSYKDELLSHQGELQPKYKDHIQLISEPYLNTEYLGFLVDPSMPDENPLKKVEIRKAINYGFDRKKMIRYLRNNIGYPGTGGMIPLGLPGHLSNKGYDYNPQKAKELLSQAGYPNGKGLSPITLATTASYLDLCKYIQQQLSLLGIAVKIDVNPPGALRELIAQSKTDWFRGSWIADYPDAENYLSLFFSPNFCPIGPNYTHFADKSFDHLYVRARQETNDQVRHTLYREMDSILMSHAPVVVLFYDQVLRFCRNDIENFHANPMNLLVLKHVRKRSPALVKK